MPKNLYPLSPLSIIKQVVSGLKSLEQAQTKMKDRFAREWEKWGMNHDK